MSLVRWQFEDPDGILPTWTFPINPATMDAPDLGDEVTINIFGLRGEVHDAPMPQRSLNWTFQGVLYTLADQEAMEGFLNNARPIKVHDHSERVFLAMLQSVDTTRAGTRRTPQRHKYTAHMLMLERLT